MPRKAEHKGINKKRKILVAPGVYLPGIEANKVIVKPSRRPKKVVLRALKPPKPVSLWPF